ncbi:MAG TPA: NAD-dependent epimerase/dehydratase family protein [Solirubrobacterales bacterium]
MSRYLVTGCAGFVGSTLVDALLAEGSEVVGIDAFTDYYPRERKEAALSSALSDPAFELIEHDLGSGPPPAALDGVDGVFHLAARPGVRASWGDGFEPYLHDNVLATHKVAERAAERDLRLVFASSSSVYGDALAYPTREDAQPAPVSPYGVTKLTCEHLLRAHSRNFGLDYVALRYFTVYGPRQRPDMAFARIVDALVAGTPFEVYGDGRQSRDFTFVRDAVAATMLAMHKGASGTTYNVGGGSEAALRESVEIVEELSGRTLDVRYGDEAAGDVRRTLADTGRIRDEIGWEPAVELRAGLASMLEATGAIVPAGRDND